MPNIEIFCSASGWVPYDEFQDMLRGSGNLKVLDILAGIIDKLATSGLLLLGTNQMDHIEDDIFELRPRRYRLFCFYDRSRDSFILLNGFLKETQQTPEREKRIARNLVDQYRKSREAP